MSTGVVTSRANPRVKQLRAAFADNARLAGGLVAIEGEHLLQEAVRSSVSLKSIFVREGQRVPEWLPANVPRLELSRDVFASAVDTQSPQGLAALLDPPKWALEDACGERGAPLILVTAGLQDPGNLGTLIRSAEAFGATGVLTTAGTVSKWNQKSLRASAGSVFRLPVAQIIPADLSALHSRGVRVFAAAAEQAADRLRTLELLTASEADLTDPCALMIGNEGAGISEDWLRLADALITIPMPGPVESLNAAVAGSLLLYEASRQRSANPETRRRNPGLQQ